MTSARAFRGLSPLPVGIGATLVWLAGVLTVLLTVGLAVYGWAFSPRYAERERFVAALQSLPPGVTETQLAARFGAPQYRLPLRAGEGPEELGFGTQGRWLLQGSCRHTSPRFPHDMTVLAYDASWGMSFEEALIILDPQGRLASVWLALD